MIFTAITNSLMHFALCVAMLSVFLVTSECTASDSNDKPVVTAPTAASVAGVGPGTAPGVVPDGASGENPGNTDGHDEDDADHDDDDNDEDNGDDDQAKKKKPGVGSDNPGSAGTGAQAASSQAGVVAANIPDAGTDLLPGSPGVSPEDGRAGYPLNSHSSPGHSNGSGGSGSGSGKSGNGSADGLPNTEGRDVRTLPGGGVSLSGAGSTGNPGGGGGLDSTRVDSGTSGSPTTGGTDSKPGASSGGSTTQTSTGSNSGTVAPPNKDDKDTPNGKPGLTVGTGSTIYSTTTTKMVDDVKPEQNTNESSTAQILPLTKPTKTVQQTNSVDKKNDGSSSTFLALAYAALLAIAMMTFAQG